MREEFVIGDELSVAMAPVKRLVFREWLAGDRQKALAQSAVSGTGGGARDLRIGPYTEFKAVFEKFFPEVRTATRRRGGKKVELPLRVGRFYWNDGPHVRSAEAIFEPPTDARGGEGRVSMIHRYPTLRAAPAESEGRAVILLFQDEHDRIWPYFASEASLRSGEWDDRVADFILGCVSAARPSNRAAKGYFDLDTDERYCDGG